MKTFTMLLLLAGMVHAQDQEPPLYERELFEKLDDWINKYTFSSRDALSDKQRAEVIAQLRLLVLRPPVPPGQERRAPLDVDAVRAYLREFEPALLRRLEEVQGEGRREEHQRILMEAQGRMREMAEVRRHSPERHERLLAMRRKEAEAHELAEKIRRTPEGEREALTAELKTKLGTLFDEREKGRADELAELKKRVGELEKALDERKARKGDIVERRRKQLMGERVEGEDW